MNPLGAQNSNPTAVRVPQEVIRQATRRALSSLHSLRPHQVITTTDKATGSFAFICREWYEQKIVSTLSSATYQQIPDSADGLAANIIGFMNENRIPHDLLLNRAVKDRVLYNLV